MYLAKMQENSKSGHRPNNFERFVFVLQGNVVLSDALFSRYKLEVDSYAYVPKNTGPWLKSDTSATLVVFERRKFSITSTDYCFWRDKAFSGSVITGIQFKLATQFGWRPLCLNGNWYCALGKTKSRYLMYKAIGTQCMTDFFSESIANTTPVKVATALFPPVVKKTSKYPHTF